MDMGTARQEHTQEHFEITEEKERKRRPVGADEIAVMAKLVERDGLLKPPEVVKAARPEESPMHDRFTWDDGIAGEKYRIIEARDLIKRVVLVDAAQPDRKIPVYVSLGSDRLEEGGGYRPLRQVLGAEDLKREMLRTAYAELKSIRKRYEDLKELAGIMRAIDRTLPKDDEE